MPGSALDPAGAGRRGHPPAAQTVGVQREDRRLRGPLAAPRAGRHTTADRLRIAPRGVFRFTAARMHALALVSLVVRDYDEALAFYVGKLGFTLIEDVPIPEQGKRWVVVAPSGGPGCHVLLARAASPAQLARIGDQTGGRVFLFLTTDDFARDFAAFRAQGVEFVRGPTVESYGTVAVFKDLYGNLWDLVQRRARP